MAEKFLVFGGWALDPCVLRPLFPGDAIFIDINQFMDKIITGEYLSVGWQDRLMDLISPFLPQQPFFIAGWSTGAIAAAALATWVNPVAGVFLSATPSFCRRRDINFSFGKRDTILKSMRAQLAIDPSKVVAEFVNNCGLPENAIVTATTSLSSGLVFLEKACLLPVEKFSFPSLFLHGSRDEIVPIDAGRYFSSRANGTFVEIDGPHAFFAGRHGEIRQIVSDFMKEAV